MNRNRQTIDSAHKCGDIVTRKTGTDEDKGVITGIVIRPIGIVYLVTWEMESDERTHYECELQPIGERKESDE